MSLVHSTAFAHNTHSGNVWVNEWKSESVVLEKENGSDDKKRHQKGRDSDPQPDSATHCHECWLIFPSAFSSMKWRGRPVWSNSSLLLYN